MANIPAADLELQLAPGAVKTAVRDVEGKSGDLWMVPPDSIHVIDGFNLRISGTPEYDEGIQLLKHSIITEGFYKDKPLTAYVGKSDQDTNVFFLTDGHRRFAALQLAIAEGAAIDLVPVLVKPPGTSMEDLTVAMMKTGEPLTPISFAIGCKRLINYGMEPEQVAKRLGITGRYVHDLLLLIGGPAKIRKMVMEGKVSATLAIKQLRSSPKTAVAKLTAGAETAKKAGKAKVTERSLPPDEAPAQANGVHVEKHELKARAGDILSLNDIQLYQAINGGTWYTLTETPDEVQIVNDIVVKISVKQSPAAAAPVEGADDL